jgi:hypothetical protein
VALVVQPGLGPDEADDAEDRHAAGVHRHHVAHFDRAVGGVVQQDPVDIGRHGPDLGISADVRIEGDDAPSPLRLA